MNAIRLHRVIACAVILGSGAASADDAAVGWEPGFTVVPYGWLAGFEGEVGTSGDDVGPDLPERIDVSVDDELDEIGFMFYGELRGERWFAFFDSVWANVSQDADISLPNLLPSTEAHAGIDGNIYELAFGYRLFTEGSSTISLYGGARYYDIDAEARFEGGLLPQGVTANSGETWTDGVVGARWGIRFSDRWHGLVLADMGFGESDTSWQLFATAAYRFNDWGSAVFGYRYLTLDYDTPEFRADLTLHGPAVGLAIRF